MYIYFSESIDVLEVKLHCAVFRFLEIPIQPNSPKTVVTKYTGLTGLFFSSIITLMSDGHCLKFVDFKKHEYQVAISNIGVTSKIFHLTPGRLHFRLAWATCNFRWNAKQTGPPFTLC